MILSPEGEVMEKKEQVRDVAMLMITESVDITESGNFSLKFRPWREKT